MMNNPDELMKKRFDPLLMMPTTEEIQDIAEKLLPDEKLEKLKGD